MTVHKTFNDTEEYSLRSIAILGCNIYSQITMAHVTLPKAVLITVKIFAVYNSPEFLKVSLGSFGFHKVLLAQWHSVLLKSMQPFLTAKCLRTMC